MRAEEQVEVRLRRVAPDDWRALRALRLEALADFPLAYCERLADAQAAPDGDWQGRAARGAAGGDSFQVLAWAGDRPVGTSLGFRHPSGTVRLAAVYVAPGHRGRGLLGELVEQVAQWARAQGAGVLDLQVHEDNPRARAAYRRLGFTETGERAPYPLGAGDELTMARPLR